MHAETELSPALTLMSVCVGKNAQFRYSKNNVRVKGLNTNKSKSLRYANDFADSKILNDFIVCIAHLNEKVS